MRHISIFFVLAIFSRAVFAGEFDCPREIRTRQESADSFEGWKVFQVDTPSQLSRVVFFDGPPEEKGALVPDNDHEVKVNYSLWTLPQPAARGEYWMSCVYTNTTLALSRPLPKSLTECSVIYQKKVFVDGYPAVAEVKCSKGGSSK